MPKLWSATVDAHRLAVREAVLDAAGRIVEEHGPTAVTMSGLAEAAGVGRATLYKYFPDIESTLLAWHERHVHTHLTRLEQVRDREPVGRRLAAVLDAYARIVHERGSGALIGFLHLDAHVEHAQQHLAVFVRDLIAEEAELGMVRRDTSPSELAAYVLHALEAAGVAKSSAAALRIGVIVLDGLRPTADRTREV